jgi:hypothetical protein
MSQKRQSTYQNNYSQPAMQTYQGLQPQATQSMQDDMGDPSQNPFLQQQQSMVGQSINQLGQSSNQQIQQSLASTGQGNNGALSLYLQRKSQMNTQGQQSDASNNLLLEASNLRNNAISGSMSYNPLQTGGQQAQTTSGLGTWLPQLVGAGLQAGAKMAAA